MAGLGKGPVKATLQMADGARLDIEYSPGQVEQLVFCEFLGQGCSSDDSGLGAVFYTFRATTYVI